MLSPKYERGYLPAPDGARMPYLIVGEGPVPVVLIPGASDGMRTVYEWARPTAWALRGRAANYSTLLISRREPVPPGYSAEQHAEDYIRVWEELDWGPAILECSSGGGPIGQWIAVKRPDLIKGLILTSTFHRTLPPTRAVLRYWLDLARQGKWDELNSSNAEYSFSPRLAARYRPLRPLLKLAPPPKDPERMPQIFEALLDVDNRDILPRILTPTLVIGGVDDRVLGAAIQREMAQLIPRSRLLLYPGFGHYNDQENPDYLRQVDRFVRDVWPEKAAQRDSVASKATAGHKGAAGLAASLLAGGAAGMLATVPMTLVMGLLFQRLPHRQRYPLPPSQITANAQRRIGLRWPLVRRRQHRVLTGLAHFGYGSAVGSLYAPLARRIPGPAPVKGIVWGLLVWMVSYLGLLPALRLFPPATRDTSERQGLMVAAHIVWGAALGLLDEQVFRDKANHS